MFLLINESKECLVIIYVPRDQGELFPSIDNPGYQINFDDEDVKNSKYFSLLMGINSCSEDSLVCLLWSIEKVESQKVVSFLKKDIYERLVSSSDAVYSDIFSVSDTLSLPNPEAWMKYIDFNLKPYVG
jgi:hypothetical protein